MSTEPGAVYVGLLERLVRVRCDDPALSVELDDLGTHGVGLVFGEVAVGGATR